MKDLIDGGWGRQTGGQQTSFQDLSQNLIGMLSFFSYPPQKILKIDDVCAPACRLS